LNISLGVRFILALNISLGVRFILALNISLGVRFILALNPVCVFCYCYTGLGRREVCTGCWWGSQRAIDHWGDPDVDGRIIL
jgi:hypothetical protein